MSHHPTPEVLSAYLDGEATAEERHQVDAHLALCATCRQHLAELQQTAAFVQGLEPAPVPAGFRSTVRTRLQQTRPGTRRLWPLAWRPSWRVIAAATAVVLIGLFSINLLQQTLPRHALREADEVLRGAAGNSGAPAASAPATTEGKARDLAQAPAPGGLGRQVIRSATLTVDVRDVDAGAKALMRIAESVGGFVANTTLVHQKPSYGMFELRVPASQFAQVLDRVEQVGEVKERHVSGQDVTDEYVDLQARIRNFERHEHQLLTFMDRATKVADLLAIEQELARVRGEIEQLTGRLRVVNNRVELATVDVTLREKAQQKTGFWDFTASLDRIQAAFAGTVRQLLLAAERLLVVASALLPLALLAVPGWALFRWVHHRRLRLGDQGSER